jgi:sugar transferase (PEP-CTERM/EpsH1 system associated)
MRILFVAPYLPVQIRTRPYNFIKSLKKRGHSIYFVGMADYYADEAGEEELRKYCERVELFRNSTLWSLKNCFFGLFSNIAFQSAYCFSVKIKKRLKKLLLTEKFDILHIEHIRAAYALPKERSIPAIYDSVDCITCLYEMFYRESTTLPRKIINFLEMKRLESYESALLSQFDGVIISSNQDKQNLEALAQRYNISNSPIKVIQNGVDCEYFKPLGLKVEPYSIAFTGKLSYYANEIAVLHFLKEIFPLVKAQLPQVKFYVVGANPSKEIRKFENGKDVIVTAWVPDIREYLARAQVVVCPVRIKAGIQNKLLEAMAMGKGAVAYPEAASSLCSTQDKDIFLIADNPVNFSKNILELMKNETLRLSIGSNAREYVQKFYNWDDKAGELEEFYNRTIESYKSKSEKTS